MPQADVAIVFKALKEKAEKYDELYDYYDGEHPQIFLTAKLRKLFRNVDVNFSENWSSVVVDSMLERINLTGFKVPDMFQRDSEQLYSDLEVDLESDDLHEALLVTGEGYVIAGISPHEEGESPPLPEIDIPFSANGNQSRIRLPLNMSDKKFDFLELYFNDPRWVHIVYDKRRSKEKRVAAKWWIDEEEHYRMILYYPDHFEHYRSRGKAKNVKSASNFEEMESFVEENPYGIIPVFHFRTNRRIIKSELSNILDPQRALNKSLNDMMVASEFGAFRQKYVISQGGFQDDELENSPGALWDIPAGDGSGQPTTVGEFSQTDLSNYIKSLERFANTISALSRTPKHFFFQTGGNPSGEALIALEAPLNKKCQKRIDQAKPGWQEIWQFILALVGHVVNRSDIVPLYDRPETVQPLTRAQIRQANRDAGIPIRTTLRREERWTKQELEDLEEDQIAEQVQQQSALGQALLNMNAGQNGSETPQFNGNN